jgi:hypothetical protein
MVIVATPTMLKTVDVREDGSGDAEPDDVAAMDKETKETVATGNLLIDLWAQSLSSSGTLSLPASFQSLLL